MRDGILFLAKETTMIKSSGTGPHYSYDDGGTVLDNGVAGVWANQRGRPIFNFKITTAVVGNTATYRFAVYSSPTDSTPDSGDSSWLSNSQTVGAGGIAAGKEYQVVPFSDDADALDRYVAVGITAVGVANITAGAYDCWITYSGNDNVLASG